METTLAGTRKTEYDVNPIFPNRWSPRAMSGQEISRPELMSLFEAARWAPSSSNSQPWRFYFALRNTQAWSAFLSLLVEGNQVWAKNASALIVMVSKKTFEHNGKFSRTHSFDTGSAWVSLALQGSLNGLVVHGMAGFDYDKAKTLLELSDDFQVEAMAAIGKPGPKESLPEKLQAREVPSPRKNVAEFAFEMADRTPT